MSPSNMRPTPPTGVSRLFYRAPIVVYRLGLGGLMGGRFLLLTHTGRMSGLPRQTVLEVVDANKAISSYSVVSAWGDKSDWYLNIVKQPLVSVQVGRQKWPAMARPLSPEQCGEAMVTYARRHPMAARNLLRLVGYAFEPSEGEYRRIGYESLRFVTFEPRLV